MAGGGGKGQTFISANTCLNWTSGGLNEGTGP